MGDLPGIGIFAADAREVGAGALRSPEHGVIVFGLDRQRIRTVALDLVAQCADHLRMTGVAALADVDVAAGKLERRVDAHVGGVLHRLVDGEERRDLDEAADRRHADDGEHEADGAAFELAVELGHGRLLSRLHRAGGGWDVGGRCRLPSRPIARGRGSSSRRCRADDRAEQEQEAADGSRDIVGVHGDERVDEGDRRACRSHCRCATSGPG